MTFVFQIHRAIFDIEQADEALSQIEPIVSIRPSKAKKRKMDPEICQKNYSKLKQSASRLFNIANDNNSLNINDINKIDNMDSVKETLIKADTNITNSNGKVRIAINIGEILTKLGKKVKQLDHFGSIEDLIKNENKVKQLKSESTRCFMKSLYKFSQTFPRLFHVDVSLSFVKNNFAYLKQIVENNENESEFWKNIKDNFEYTNP